MCVADDDERKPYFRPREAKPDHPVIKRRGAPAVVAVNQVVPPDIQNGFDSQAVSNEDFLRKLSLLLSHGGLSGHT